MPFTRRALVVLPLATGALAWSGLAGRAAAADTGAGTGSGGPAAEPESVPFAAGTGGYAVYRVPAVLSTAAGTLVAFAEARASTSDTGTIVVVARRSVDGGRSWGPLAVVSGDGSDTRGNPCPVLDRRTGAIVLLTCSNAADATEEQIMSGELPAADGRRVWVQHSTDDGRSFGKPAEITAEAKRPDWRWYATGPGHAVQLASGPYRGRLVVPANHSAAPPAGSSDTGTEDRYYGGHCLLSDDGGHSWRIGFTDDDPDGVVNANETSCAQLPDGTLYFNARDQNGTAPGVRVDARSADGGRTLLRPYGPQVELAGPVVQGSVLQPAAGPLLFSGPADPGARAVMTVRASADGGHTWKAVRTLSQLPAAYSDLVQIDHGEVGLLYETGTETSYDRIAFARLPLRELVP
jgi:sialidase-1